MVLRGFGIVGDFADLVVLEEVEVDAVGVFDRDVQGAEDERRAFEVDGVAHQRVDDLHQCDLDGLFVLDEGDGMETGLRWRADAAMHALVEVAELFSAK